MSELKTKPGGNVTAFLEAIKDEGKKNDCLRLLKLMKQATGEEPVLWGGRIAGFGSYQYKGKSGRSGTWFITGFAANKQNLTIYIIAGFNRYEALMKQLGKYKTGVSCLYINSLKDINEPVLKELITTSYKYMKQTYTA